MRVILALLAAAFFAAAVPARGQTAVDTLADGRSGKVHFNSVTPTGYFQLARGAPMAQTTVFGTLLLPPGSSGRTPAMVVAHGSGGVSDAREFKWARRLVAAGIAAFVVDSFTPRHIDSTAADQSKLSTAANVADAFSALKLLATHPRIDPARIGVIGFSKGGQVALYTALEPYRTAIMKDSPARFAAHVALYPYCNDWHVTEHLTGSPLLLLLGGRDNYTPAQDCEDYAGWLRSKGVEATVIVYPQAVHGFDGTLSVRHVADVVSGRNCRDTIDIDRFTVTLRPSGDDITATARDYFRKCFSRGAMIGGDAEARQRAPADVNEFLKRAFKL